MGDNCAGNVDSARALNPLKARRAVDLQDLGAALGLEHVHAGDLETTAPVCVALLGAAPSRRWVVEWSGAVERLSTGPVAGTGLVFEAVFNEEGNTIDYYFQSVTGTASSRYHGLEGPTGLSTGSVSGCPSATTSHLCTVMTAHRVRFSPAP